MVCQRRLILVHQAAHIFQQHEFPGSENEASSLQVVTCLGSDNFESFIVFMFL